MYFHIQNKHTKKILYGCWDSEFLYYISGIKVVSYSEYKRDWLPMNIDVDHIENKQAKQFIQKLWKRK